MSAVKIGLPLKLALLGALLSALAVALGAASPAKAENFGFCYPKTGGAFEEGACKTSGSTHSYAYGEPASGHVLAFCEEESGGTYTDPYCSQQAEASGKWTMKTSAVTVPKLAGANGSTAIVWDDGGSDVDITCTGGSFEGNARSEGAVVEASIELTSCSVSKPSGCTVNSGGAPTGDIRFADTSGKLEESSGKPTYKFNGETTSTLFELEFSGTSCTLKGYLYSVEGSQKCEFGAQSALLQEHHELICKASGSSMTIGASSVTYEGNTNIKTEGGYGWTPAAREARAPGSKYKIHYCHAVSSGEGAYANSKCSETGGSGEYVSAWPGSSGTLEACLKVASGEGLYLNGSCSEPGFGNWELKDTAWSSKLEGKLGTVTLKGTISGAKAIVECTAGTFEATPEKEGETGTGQIDLSSCQSVKPINCTISVPAMSFDSQVEESSGKLVDKLTGSLSSEEFGSIAYSGSSCSVKGYSFPLKGSQKCEFETSVGTFAEKHELDCATTGSKLTYAGSTATYEAAGTITAPGGESWSASS